MKKVTGIGGVFFKSKDSKALNEWYKTHLGFDTNEYGASFEWREDADPEKKEPPNGVLSLILLNTLNPLQRNS